jgi:hypothetical protein
MSEGDSEKVTELGNGKVGELLVSQEGCQVREQHRPTLSS